MVDGTDWEEMICGGKHGWGRQFPLSERRRAAGILVWAAFFCSLVVGYGYGYPSPGVKQLDRVLGVGLRDARGDAFSVSGTGLRSRSVPFSLLFFFSVSQLASRACLVNFAHQWDVSTSELLLNTSCVTV